MQNQIDTINVFRFLSWTESYLKIDPPIKITVCRFLEKVSSIPNMASEVFEMAYSKCVIMFSSLMRSEDWIVAVYVRPSSFIDYE
jgi:hypothetical protein